MAVDMPAGPRVRSRFYPHRALSGRLNPPDLPAIDRITLEEDEYSMAQDCRLQREEIPTSSGCKTQFGPPSASRSCVGQSEAEGPPIEAVSYRAVVTVSLKESSFAINPELPSDLVIGAILSPPEWTMRPWSAPSPLELSTSVTNDQLEYWALQKLSALFDFAAVLPDGTASEIEHGLLERFPLLAVTPEESVTDASHYKRIAVHSEVLETGEAFWGFDVPEEGEFPPGVPGVHTAERVSILDVNSLGDDNLIDLDIFVQNLVRIDLRRRLEAR